MPTSLPTPQLGSRALFPTLSARVYLNHAAISPFSAPVTGAITRLTGAIAERGLAALNDSGDARDAARAAFATLIGASAQEVALVHNTTAGVRAVAFGLPWQAGDRLITFAGEFPANVTPWAQAAQTFDLKLERVPLYTAGAKTPLDADWSADLLARTEAVLQQGRCRVVAVSAVQFDTGVRMPVRALATLAHAYGALLLVDGIQACGVVPIDIQTSGADFVACGGHKWLMGAEGAGFLWASPEASATLLPRMAGWMSDDDPFDFLVGETPRLRYDKPIRHSIDFLEGGANSALGYAAAAASIPLLNTLSVAAIFAHVQAYHDALEPTLTALGFHSHRSPDPALRSGSLTALPPARVSLSHIIEALKQRGIAVSSPNGRIRFAPHWPNALHEVRHVAKALQQACQA